MQPFGIIQTESGHGLEAWERRSMALLCDVPDCNKPSDCVSPKADSVETFWPQLAACFFGFFWGFFFSQHPSSLNTPATSIQKNRSSDVFTATPDSDWTGPNNVFRCFCEDRPPSQQNKMLAGNASAIYDSHRLSAILTF